MGVTCQMISYVFLSFRLRLFQCFSRQQYTVLVQRASILSLDLSRDARASQDTISRRVSNFPMPMFVTSEVLADH